MKKQKVFTGAEPAELHLINTYELRHWLEQTSMAFVSIHTRPMACGGLEKRVCFYAANPVTKEVDRPANPLYLLFEEKESSGVT